MDRRRNERYSLDVPIKITRYDDGALSTYEGFSKDISSKSVFILTNGFKFESMQAVHLELTLTIEKLKELFGYSNTVTLQVDGSVVRASEHGIVVQFGNRYSIVPATQGR